MDDEPINNELVNNVEITRTLQFRQNFSRFYNELWTDEIKQLVTDLIISGNDEHTAGMIYGGRSWANIFTVFLDQMDSLQQASVLPGNYDILALTTYPENSQQFEAKYNNYLQQINVIYTECALRLTSMKIHQEQVGIDGYLQFDISRYSIGPSPNTKSIYHHGTISYGKSFNFDLWYIGDPDDGDEQDPLGIKFLGNEYDDTQCYKLIFYFELSIVKDVDIIRTNFVDKINLTSLGLYFISNMLVTERKDKGYNLDTIRENLFMTPFHDVTGEEGIVFNIMLSQLQPLLANTHSLSVEDSMKLLFSDIYDHIFPSSSNMTYTQSKIFFRLFERYNSVIVDITNGTNIPYASYVEFFNQFQNDCLDTFWNTNLPSLRQLIQTILTVFNLTMGGDGVIQISGGDTYRRVDPNLHITADIDCKVFIPERQYKQSFINKIKILLMTLLPILNTYYIRIHKQLQINFGSTTFTLVIDSTGQPNIFSVRQLLRFVVPLISLDCRLNTKLSWDAKQINGRILMTPLDIAFSSIPDDYQRMINDKQIRTSYNIELNDSRIGRDCLLIVLDIEEQYQSYVYNTVINGQYFNQTTPTNVVFLDSSRKSNIGYLITDEKTLLDTTSNANITYVIAYLPPIPSPYEQCIELQKLSSDEYRPQRIAADKHEKDQERYATIVGLKDLASEANTNEPGSRDMVQHRLKVEQYESTNDVNTFITILSNNIIYLNNEGLITNEDVKTKDAISDKAGHLTMLNIRDDIIPHMLTEFYNRIPINNSLTNEQITTLLYEFAIKPTYKTPYGVVHMPPNLPLTQAIDRYTRGRPFGRGGDRGGKGKRGCRNKNLRKTKQRKYKKTNNHKRNHLCSTKKKRRVYVYTKKKRIA